jgi:hypothetical protein
MTDPDQLGVLVPGADEHVESEVVRVSESE